MSKRIATGPILLMVVCMILAGCATPQEYREESMETRGSTSWQAIRSSQTRLNYVITFPTGYDGASDDRWPLIVFLHSIEERGGPAEFLIRSPDGQGLGLAGYALEQPDFPFITMSPVCPARNYWTFMHRRLARLVEEVTYKYAVDPERIYLTGVSMGGMGVWSLGMARPELFSAIAPIAGGVYTPPIRRRYRRLADTPVRAFHGRGDPSIPMEKNLHAVERVVQAGGSAQIEILETDSHYIQERVFRESDLFAWFGNLRASP